MYAAIRQEKPVRIKNIRKVVTVAPPSFHLFSIDRMRVINTVTITPNWVSMLGCLVDLQVMVHLIDKNVKVG